MIPLVPDTGVLVKFIVKEEYSPQAMALLGAAVEGTYHLAAPDFMAIEFGNVLWKYVRRAVMKEAEARRHIERFPFDRIEWLPARLLLMWFVPYWSTRFDDTLRVKRSVCIRFSSPLRRKPCAR